VYSKPRQPWPSKGDGTQNAKDESQTKIRLIKEMDATVPHGRPIDGST
jgi:hypothetical protein